MNSDLEAIKDAWDKTTGEGRDEAGTRALADAYVAANPSEFEDYLDMSLEDCVKSVENARTLGLESAQWRAETWLLHRFEPQKIGGAAEARIRIPGPGA